MRGEGREGQQEVRQMKNKGDVRMLEPTNATELNHVHNHRSIYTSQQSDTPQSMQESITHRGGNKECMKTGTHT